MSDGMSFNLSQAAHEVALVMLLSPDATNPQSISTSLGRTRPYAEAGFAELQDLRLVAPDGSPISPSLFQALAQAWSDLPEAGLRQEPGGDPQHETQLYLGLSNPAGPGWALAGDAAARAWEIPIASTDGPRRFYVPGRRYWDAAITVLGKCPVDEAAVVIRRAPGWWVTKNRVDAAVARMSNDYWPIVSAVVSALEVAASGQGAALTAWRSYPPELAHVPWPAMLG